MKHQRLTKFWLTGWRLPFTVPIPALRQVFEGHAAANNTTAPLLDLPSARIRIIDGQKPVDSAFVSSINPVFERAWDLVSPPRPRRCAHPGLQGGQGIN